MSDGYFVPGKGWTVEDDPARPAPDAELEDESADLMFSNPIVLNYHGEPTEFFPISALALALNRSAVTMRKWETKGFIPGSSFGSPTRALGGRVRLYTRRQLVQLREIAREEGLLDDLSRPVTKTKFPERARELFGGNDGE